MASGNVGSLTRGAQRRARRAGTEATESKLGPSRIVDDGRTALFIRRPGCGSWVETLHVLDDGSVIVVDPKATVRHLQDAR